MKGFIRRSAVLLNIKVFVFKRAIQLKELGERFRWQWLSNVGLNIREAVLSWKN
jgi:hypothetical protein